MNHIYKYKPGEHVRDQIFRALDWVGVWHIRLDRGIYWHPSLAIQCFGKGIWSQFSQSAGMVLWGLDTEIAYVSEMEMPEFPCMRLGKGAQRYGNVIPEDPPPNSSWGVLKDGPFLKATKCTCEGINSIFEKCNSCCLVQAGIEDVRRSDATLKLWSMEFRRIKGLRNGWSQVAALNHQRQKGPNYHDE